MRSENNKRVEFNGYQFEHGTRGSYVQGCRCAPCREANTRGYHEREARAKTAVGEHQATPTFAIAKTWTAPDGTRRTRVYRRACPGVEGEPCPRGRHLRKDSLGGVCSDCRHRLIWNGLVDAAPARRHLRKLSRRGVGYKSVADASDVGKTTLAKILSGEKKWIRRQTAQQILGVTALALADHGLVPAARTWVMLRALTREYFTQAALARKLGYKTAALQFGRRRVLAKTEHRIERFYRKVTGEAFGR